MSARPPFTTSVTPLILLLAAVLALPGCGPKPERKYLVVGMELAYPPFEIMTEKGEPAEYRSTSPAPLASPCTRK